MPSSLWDRIVGYIPELLGALVILIVGWLIAILMRNVLRGVIRRTPLNAWLGRWLGNQTGASPVDAAQIVGNIGYYIILILTFIGALEALGLTLITEPLKLMTSQILTYLPRFLAAGLVLLVAWIVATILRAIVTHSLRLVRIDERVSAETPGETQPPVSQVIGEAVYWLIFLIFLPVVLEALGLSTALGPLQTMLTDVFSAIPKLIYAGIILLVGWFVANIIRRIVASALAGVGLDRLANRVGITNALGGRTLSGLVGLLVYILLLIPILIASLDALNMTALTAPLTAMLTQALAAIPLLFFAAILLIVAYFFARIVSDLVGNLLASIGFDTVPGRLGLTRVVLEGGRTPSRLIADLVFVVILVLATIEAASLLRFEAVALLLGAFLALLARIILGLIILAIGIYLANVVGGIVDQSALPRADLLGLITRIAIIALALPMALQQMGLGSEIVTIAFTLLLGSMAVAVAIAFGVGGRATAAELVAEWRVRLVGPPSRLVLPNPTPPPPPATEPPAGGE
ncbi:MAG: mechanosensitive ion channel [Chloroflexi bacterium]|nr:mechanosensitive ion channel [Chloroflexota bacterium]